MEVRLLDSGLADIKSSLKKFARKVIAGKKYKAKPEKCRLWIVVKRGDIVMKEGEWLKNPKMYWEGNKPKVFLSDGDINALFDKNNLNMGILGYGNPKGGLKELVKWVKHNVNPKQLQGENRDLNIKIDDIKPGKKGKSAQITLIVPEKGLETSKDLENAKLKSLDYIGAKDWTNKELGKIKDSDKKLDKILVAVLTGKAKLKDKVEDVLKNE